ncbi:MAG: hypothetical protein BWY42_01090 [Candidatus Omnitrophica bacterium ADurb.Bin277]|nr:MAG: hypothetical protein BWY42_01090 [Candidatus Omnitrophica bacterium ADurb.Bin277]
MAQKIAFFFLLLVSIPGMVFASPIAFDLKEHEIACLEKTIFLNECASEPENLITWPVDEDFPSLGIGHFIWYPVGREGPFKETFPELLLFMRINGRELPGWLTASPGPPWHDRDSYLQDRESERAESLRDFLFETREIQTRFIIERTRRSLPDLLAALPVEERPKIERRLSGVLSVPNGPLAVIDYINFKGEGVLEAERFRGQGWGLLQVLEEMSDTDEEEEILPEFVRAAKRVLDRRVENAPPDSKERDRIGGWKFRVQRYLTSSC